jgi:hypothetical protein
MAVAVVPDTVQTVDVAEAKVTGSPELAVALIEKEVPAGTVVGRLKVIVCGVSETPNCSPAR